MVLGALVAAASGVSALSLLGAGSSALASARDVLTTGEDDAALVVRTRLGDDPAGQDGVLHAVLGERFGVTPLDVSRSLATSPLGLDTHEGVRVVLATPADGATGAGPGSGEVIVPDDVAAELGVAVGDVLEVEGTDLAVAATGPTPDEAPSPVADPEPGVLGPLLADEDTVRALVDAPFVVWRVGPEVSALDADAFALLAEGSDGLELALTRAEGFAVRGVTVTGSLGTAAARADQVASTVRAVGLVPVVLLVTVAVTSLAQVTRLLVRGRDGEVDVLLARGGDPGRLVRWAAGEATAVGVVGVLVGVGAAGVVGGGGTPGVLVGVGVVAVVVVTVTLAVTAGRQVRGLVRGDLRAGRTRARTAAFGGGLLAGLAVAAVATWRLLRSGDAVADATADPLAAAAPAAVLVALAVLGAALLVPSARLAESVARRRRPLGPSLVARQVSRRTVVHAVPVVLLVLAVGTVSVAGAYAGSVAQHRSALDRLATGSDVGVTLPPEASARSGDPRASSSAPYAELDGVTAAASVVRASPVLGERPVELTALPMDLAPEVVRGPVTVDAHAGELVADVLDDARPVLPAGASTVLLEVRVTSTADATEPVELAAWVADADGGLSRLPLGPVRPAPGEERVALEATLPGPGPHRLAALDVEGGEPGSTVALEVVRVAVAEDDGTVDVPLPDVPWAVAEGLTTGVAEVTPSGPLGVTVDVTGPDAAQGRVPRGFVRVLPPAADGVPVAITSALADRVAVGEGDRVRVALAGPEVTVRVAGTVDAVPGTLAAEALLADLPTLGHELLHARRTPLLPSEVWLAVDDPAQLADVARVAGGLAGPGSSVAAAGAADPTEASAPVVRAFWTVAVAAVLLALTGVAAVAVALLRSRRAEVVVLRAVGRTPRAQARSRAAEHLAVALPALAVGVGVGALTAALVVPPLVRSSVLAQGPVPVAVGVDLTGTGLLVLVLAVGAAAIAVVAAVTVGRQALDREYREEVR